MLNKDDKKEQKKEQTDALMNVWMQDINETPEEKAAREKLELEKEQKRAEESK